MMRIAELSDSLSPILVKELRQGRRSRALVLLAVLTFVASGLILFAFCVRATGEFPDQRLFEGLYTCLSVVGSWSFRSWRTGRWRMSSKRVRGTSSS